MANEWFRFKKFTIRQDQCAMKVGTDGVILGAWTSVEGVRRALDIGTGTGLLALMLTQRSPELMIDAIEIDPAAAKQAAENIAESEYADRVRVQQVDFLDFDPVQGGCYDLVICNPPYFNRSRKSEGASRNLARHADTLDLERLFSGAAIVLGATGRISIIIPSDQSEAAIKIAETQGFFPKKILEVLPVPGAAPKRHCLDFSRGSVPPVLRSIVIEAHGRHGYSDAYRELTKDFYLD